MHPHNEYPIVKAIFPRHSHNPNQINQLFNAPPLSKCVFNSLVNEGKSQKADISLEIYTEFVVQRAGPINKVFSLLALDYYQQFQIIRKASQIPNRLGQADGIRFLLTLGQRKINIQLGIDSSQRQNLQNFGSLLSRLFIVQLGFHTCFKAIKKIGKGMTACVYNALCYASGNEVAIKSFKRSIYFEQDNGNGKLSFMKQFKILTHLEHKNLCKLLSVFQTQNSTYVILQLYQYSLYSYLQRFGFPHIQKAKHMMFELLQGLESLHSKGIMHRDLKLQNIMVKKTKNLNQSDITDIPIIVDFGLAEYIDSKKYLYTRCGTPGYVAPQVLKLRSTDPIQTYTEACDVFSMGVIFHILLFKKPLFQGKDVKQVIQKNSACQIDFEAEYFSSINPQCHNLLVSMLNKNPKERISALQAINHPFFQSQRMPKQPIMTALKINSVNEMQQIV